MAININKSVTLVLSMILLAVIVFSFVGNSASTIVSSADTITEANNCSLGTDATGAEWDYNSTDKYCYNTTDKLYLAGQIDLPLNSLFGSSGVVILIVMAGLLLTMISLFLRKKQ